MLRTDPLTPCNRSGDDRSLALDLPSGLSACAREHIRQRLATRDDERNAPYGDHQVAGLEPPRIALSPAAVLIALLDRPTGTQILLTRRSAHLKHHAGQVSFPGGRRDPTDIDLRTTALREAYEEVGLHAERADVLGHLNDYQTGTGFLVTPIVAAIDPGALCPNPAEVAEIFELPLKIALERRNYQRGSYHRDGQRRSYYVLPYRHYHIWGATAAMLVSLCETLQPHEP